jgi:type IV pilus assembly protein PilC
MQAYRYKGFDDSGKKVEGEIKAANPDEVERKMAAQAVSVIAIYPVRKGVGKPETSATPKEGWNPFRKKVSVEDTAAVLRDLAVMAETGVPFIEALEAAIITARTPTLRAGLQKLKDEVVGGRTLSQAIRSAGIFPSIVSDMINVAEEGSRLDRALSSAATYMERAADLKKKVKNAMLYPTVLSVIALSTIVVMVTFVLPRFANIFKGMKAKIPPSTQFLLNLGEAIRSQPVLAVGSVVGVVILAKLLWRIPAVQRAFYIGILKVPVIGELIRRLALSRALASISTLVNGNVSLLAALENGARVSGNPLIHDGLMKARQNVEHGATLADSLRETNVFPPQLVQMVSVGERTGRLGVLMQNTAAHMEEDVDGRLKALISIVEPVMIVVMGTIVGGITMSIILPMYSIVENVR